MATSRATGAGGDKDARQDMFATQTTDYKDDEIVDGTGTTWTIGSQDRFDVNAPMYKHIAALQQLRAKYPALADGRQIHLGTRRIPAGCTRSAGFGTDNVEYLVIAATRQPQSLRRSRRMDRTRG